MGSGIAESAARAGLSVTIRDVDEAAVGRRRGRIEKSLGRAASGGKIDAEDAEEIRGRVSLTAELEDLADADLVIEAVPENVELKASILGPGRRRRLRGRADRLEHLLDPDRPAGRRTRRAPTGCSASTSSARCR